MFRALPWVLAVTSSLLALWVALLPEPAPIQAGVSVTPEVCSTSEVSPAPDPLRVARTCLARLESARAALETRTPPGRGDPDGVEACLARPDVQHRIEEKVADVVMDHAEQRRDLAARARERQRAAFDAWSQEALSLTDDERTWLHDYVCAARELRHDALASLDDGPPRRVLEELRRQREAVLADLERTLGSERYASLRAIGGIGLLGDSIECG